MAYAINTIPRLPYGEGIITIHNDELLVYEKVKGTKSRKSVYGKTPKECIEKMRELEMELHQKKSVR